MSDFEELDQAILHLLTEGPKRSVELHQELQSCSYRTIRYRLQLMAEKQLIENGQFMQAPKMTFRYWRLTKAGWTFLASSPEGDTPQKAENS